MAPTYLQVSLRLNSGPHVSGLPEGLVRGRGSAHPSLSMSSTQSLPCHLWQHIQRILIRHVLLLPPEERTMKSLSADFGLGVTLGEPFQTSQPQTWHCFTRVGAYGKNSGQCCCYLPEALAPSTSHLDFTGEIHLGQEESQGVTEAGKRSHAYRKSIQFSKPCTHNSSPWCPLLARITPALERNGI